MCGITGFLSSEYNYSCLELMNQSLTHRGPDSEGYFHNHNIGLAHKRLSILDLSEAGSQPMYSADGRYVIVFNGEVYNFKEIAASLNYTPKTGTDTEVILEAFARQGTNFVNSLNGMFAIAIADTITNDLYLFRDRIGVKPLFYFSDGNNFAFSSEIKSLVKNKFIQSKLEVNYASISEFLHLGYISEPNTIYKNVFKFPAGAFAKINSGAVEFTSYWKPENKITPSVLNDYQKAKQTLKGLIESSINYRLISDVPFGTFLSGGIDSSLVTAVAQSLSSEPVKTFSIGFKEAKFNETKYSGAVAKYLGTDHHEFIVSEKDALDVLEKVFDNFDEPMADTSAIPTYLVSKMASEYVTMVLSGDGGDELFMGYGAYTWARRFSNPLFRYSSKGIGRIFSAFGNSRLKRVGNLLNYQDFSEIKSHIFSQEQYFFTSCEIQQLLNKPYFIKPQIEEAFDGLSRRLSLEEEQALFDLKYYLKDDLMVKVDRASMLCSIEAREPLLDYRLVEFALNLTPELKVKNGINKYLLKEVLYDYIPSSFFDRPKWGFSIPLVYWLKNELKFLIDDYLSEDKINLTNVFNSTVVDNYVQRYLKGEDYLYNRIWAMICLQKWILTHR